MIKKKGSKDCLCTNNPWVCLKNIGSDTAKSNNPKKYTKSIFFKKAFLGFVIFIFFNAQIYTLFPQKAYAQGTINLPDPQMMIALTPHFIPAVMKGIKVFPDNPLRFDFIIDTGNTHFEGKTLKTESSKLIKYFLTSLTIPEDELWVNLSPYEKNRIISDKFGITEMGRDLLAEDYVLKQLASSLMYPEDELGEKFWNKVYHKAFKNYGTTDIAVNTFNKVWIVPEVATIHESGEVAFIVETHLKVMLEGDYFALNEDMNNKKGSEIPSEDKTKELSDVSSQIIQEVILPEIEKEVNNGQNFVALRQIYHSMIMATWFKRNLRESLLGRLYVEKNKISGIDIKDTQIKEKIYKQYLEAFKLGVYNYIKEDYDPITKKIIPRKYFSGGMKFGREAVDRALVVERKKGFEVLTQAQKTTDGSLKKISAVLDPVKNLDRLRRLINILAKSENISELDNGSTEDQILEFILEYLQQQGDIAEKIEGNVGSDIRVFVISDAIKKTDLGRAIKKWVMDPKGGVKAINFKGHDGIWKIIGFESEINEQLDLELEEIQERKAGKHWIVAYNNARQKLRGDNQQIDQENAQEKFEVAKRDIISASTVGNMDAESEGVASDDPLKIMGRGVVMRDMGDGGLTAFGSGQVRDLTRSLVTDLSVENGYADRPGVHNSEELKQRHEKFLEKYNATNNLIDESDSEFGEVYQEVRVIFNALISAAGLNPASFKMLLSDEGEPNAFYLRGSNVFVVNVGLLKLGSQDEKITLSRDAIAFVLAHEIQHLRQYRKDVLSGDFDPQMKIKIGWEFITEKRKQEYLDEYDADWNAVDIMSRAGFNVREAPKIFRLLLKLMQSSTNSERSLYLPFGDHPSLEPRTLELENLVLSRYWPNSSKDATFFPEGLKIKTSKFRDFQNRVAEMNSDQEFMDLIMEAQDIRELALVISIGKKRRKRDEYQHYVDPSDEKNFSLYALVKLFPKLKELNEEAKQLTTQEEYEKFQSQAFDMLEQLPQISADLILEISQGQDTKNFQFQKIEHIQTQRNSSGKRTLTGSVNGGDLILLKENDTIVIIPTGEIQADRTIEVIALTTGERFSIKQRELLGSKIITLKKKNRRFLNSTQTLQAISTRMAQLKVDNPIKEIQIDFYEEMFKKHLDRSSKFSPRTIEQTSDFNFRLMQNEQTQNAVADRSEFDAFVKTATTEELISALENLMPTWISLESSGEGYEKFRNTLEGIDHGRPTYSRGDYIEFIDAIVRMVEQRIQSGQDSVEIALRLVSALEKNQLPQGLSKENIKKSIGETKLHLFTIFVQRFIDNPLDLNHESAKRLTEVLDDLDFLQDSKKNFDEESHEQISQMQHKIAQLLFHAYGKVDMKAFVISLFKKHIKKHGNPIKNKFYELIYGNTNMSLNEKLLAIDELGRDYEGFSFFPQDVMRAPRGEVDEYVDTIIEEIIKKQPTLSRLRTGSNILRRLATLTYLGAYSVSGRLIFEAYDVNQRKLMLTAKELRLFRTFIEADFPWRKYSMGSKGLINMDEKNQLVLLLGLLEFLKKNNQDAFIPRILLNVNTEQALGGYLNKRNYLIGAGSSTAKTPEGLAYEKDMRTFSLFLGELLNRRVDDEFAQMMSRFSGLGPVGDSNQEQGYSATSMIERLSQTRPQRFGRWEMMQDGDKNHLDYFSFLEQSYEGVSFQDAVSDLISYFPEESRLRDMLIHVLFAQKVLRDKLGIQIDSQRIFNFEWLRNQVHAQGVEIHDEVKLVLKYLGWDRDIQKLNSRFLAESNDRTFIVDKSNYNQEKDAYADVLFYDIGGSDSQLALGISSLDENYVREFLDSAAPLQQKHQMLLAYYRLPSAHRDQYVKNVLDKILDDLENGRMDLTTDTESQTIKLLEAFQNVSLRERFAVKFLEHALIIIQNKKGTVGRQDELDTILKYFPNYSYSRDEILNQFVNRQVKTSQRYKAVEHLFVHNPDNIRQTASAGYLFWKDQMRDVFMNFSASQKTQFLLWLMDAGEKPEDVIKEEYRIHISFDGLKESLGLYNGKFYKNIGRRDQNEFFNSLFLGEQGIFANQSSYNEFLDKISTNLIPSGKKSIQEFFKAVLTTDDLSRRQRVLLRLLQNYKELQGITDDERKEAVAIRIFLEANGLIGIKLGQFLAHSVFVKNGSPLQQELYKLYDSAESVDKGIIFDMFEKIYNGRAFEDHFESLDEDIARASIKIVYSAKRKGGIKVVVKAKRPEIEKLIMKDLQFLEDILNRTAGIMAQEGIPVPAGLLKRLTEILEEELNFGNLEEEGSGEANNQRHMRKNIEPRKTKIRKGQRYEFIVPVSTEVYENALMIEEFVDGIPLSQGNVLRSQGIDPEAVKELLMEELIQQFFFDGFYHADLHSGNVLIKKDGDTVYIYLIDVGATATISTSNREILVGILMALGDAKNWESNQEMLHRLFPQIQSKEGMEGQLDAVALSDKNPIQKLMQLFALLEKENIEFQEEYLEFYSVIRFLKASEYLFSNDMISKIKERFFPSDINSIKNKTSAIAMEVKKNFEVIQSPDSITSADGMQVTLTPETMQQAYDALRGLKDLSFWPTISTPFPQIDQLLDLMLGTISSLKEKSENFQLVIPQDKMTIYEDIKSDVQILINLIQNGNISPMTIMSALAAIKRIASNKNEIINFLLEQNIPIHEIIDSVEKVVGVEAAQRIKSIIPPGDSTMFLGGDVANTDFAQVTMQPTVTTSSKDVGGIDLNPNMLELQTQGTGINFDIPIDLQAIESIQLDGFSPVIFHIAPANLPLLFGETTKQNPASALNA